MRGIPVILQPAANADLQDIFLYLLERGTAWTVAASFIERITDRAERIGDAPRGGIVRPDLGEGIRMVPFERSAVILYRLTDDAVEIVNVFYGGRDYEAIMGPE